MLKCPFKNNVARNKGVIYFCFIPHYQYLMATQHCYTTKDFSVNQYCNTTTSISWLPNSDKPVPLPVSYGYKILQYHYQYLNCYLILQHQYQYLFEIQYCNTITSILWLVNIATPLLVSYGYPIFQHHYQYLMATQYCTTTLNILIAT